MYYNWIGTKDVKANGDKIFELRAKWRHEFALLLGDPEYRKHLFNLMLKIIDGVSEKISKSDKIDKSLFKDFYSIRTDLHYDTDTKFLFSNSSSLSISLGEYIYRKIKTKHRIVTDGNELINNIFDILCRPSVDLHLSADKNEIVIPISINKSITINKIALTKIFGDKEDQLKIDVAEYELSGVDYESLECFLINNFNYSYIPFYLYTHQNSLMTKIIDLGNIINSDSADFSNIEKLVSSIRADLFYLDELINDRYPIIHFDNNYTRNIDIEIITNFLNDLLGTVYNKNGIRAYFNIKIEKGYKEVFVTELLVNKETNF